MSAIVCANIWAQQAVDIHCHNILPKFIEVLNSHDAALDETFPLPDWTVENHIAFMDSAGIECSILSMPAPQPYFGDIDECRSIIRRYNEQCAALKNQHPDRFRFCAALPLPDVDAAIDEAVYALDTLGADGVKLATNSRGQYLGDAELDRLMEVLNERRAVVIVHPHKPMPVNDNLIAAAPLAVYEYPAETTRAFVNMMSRNVLSRYSDIRLVIPHCGSFIPLALPRMKAVHPAMLAKGLMKPIDWDGNMANVYYDLAGNATPEVIHNLLTITMPDHILYGSDYPYQPADVLCENKRKLLNEILTDKTLAPFADDIFHNNAVRLFNHEMDVNISSVGKRPEMCGKLPMQPDGIVRLSKIEVYPEYLDAYMDFATEVGEVSLLTEAGVLTMYAVQEKEKPCKVTILETYASRDAYESHIASEHFQKYKNGTLHMVKSLTLSDQIPLNPNNIINNFIK